MPFTWTGDNITEVAFQGLWSNSRKIVNVFHVRREEDDPAESARDALNNWQDHVINMFADNYTLQGARYTDHNEAEGATGFLLPDIAKPLAGGQSGACPAPNNCILMHKNIEAHSGVRAGRSYFPPLAETHISENGDVDSTVRAAYDEALADFHAGLSGAGSNRWVVVHKKLASLGNSDADNITGMFIDPLIATMRRRIRR